MIERAPPAVGDRVWFYNYSRNPPGPYEAVVVNVIKPSLIDLEVDGAMRLGVFHRNMTEGNAMWDWPCGN